MSGLSRTPGKRVWVNSPPRVRIPPSPPVSQPFRGESAKRLFCLLELQIESFDDVFPSTQLGLHQLIRLGG